MSFPGLSIFRGDGSKISFRYFLPLFYLFSPVFVRFKFRPKLVSEMCSEFPRTEFNTRELYHKEINLNFVKIVCKYSLFDKQG